MRKKKSPRATFARGCGARSGPRRRAPADGATSARSRPLPAASLPPVVADEWNGLLDWVLKNREGDLLAIACVPGEELVFDATGVTRVSVDQVKLIGVQTEDGGRNIVLECKELGLANVNIGRSNEDSTNLVLRVAEAHHVIESGTRPSMIIVGGGTEEQRTCVREAAKSFSGEVDREAHFQLLQAHW